MDSERQTILEKFNQNFCKYDCIIIYGLGKMTKYIAEVFGDKIAGLMDSAQTGNDFVGKRVLSETEVKDSGIRTILIAARVANVKLIYRRIADFCDKNNICVFDINGNCLSKPGIDLGNIEKYKTISFDNLKKRIANADVISFDIFDTLIMRRVLYSRDAIEFGNEFAVKRHKAVEALEYAYSLGKDVYFVSDMYLNSNTISDIFTELGIRHKRGNIIVSCDYGKEKAEGLFEVLREKAGKRKVLHVGDSLEADYEAALQDDIDNVFKIESSLQMLEDSPASSLLKYDANINNRRVIGEFIANRFNDPFLFAETNGKIRANGGDITAFVAPLVYKFAEWLKEQAKEYDIVLLGARDGFLLELIRYKFPEYNFPGKYFYTSRSAAVTAGLYSEQDIIEVSKYAFSGSVVDMLIQRFGLTTVLERRENESNTEYLLRHKAQILDIAEERRSNYLLYVDNLNIPSNAKVGFVDFISVGTCHRWLQKFMGFALEGLYFGFIYDDNNYDLKVKTLFDIGGTLGEQCAFMKNYFLIESIFSSYEPTVRCFDINGAPVFHIENRSTKQIQELKNIHDGIIEYGKQTADVDFGKVDKGLVECVIGLLDEKYCALKSELSSYATDEFTGRTT
jgi:hypothetical protein